MSKAVKGLERLIELKYDIVVDLYRQRAKALAVKRNGILGYLIAIVGPEYVGSIACMLDPYWQFVQLGKVKGKKSSLLSTLWPITPVSANRYRKRSLLPPYPLHNRSVGHTKSEDCSPSRPGQVVVTDNPPVHGDIVWTTQGALYEWMWDTTDKTRNPKSGGPKKKEPNLQSQGEMERFSPSLVTNGWTGSLRTYSASYLSLPSWNPEFHRSWTDYSSSLTPASAAVVTASVQSWPAQEKVYAIATMAKNLDSMLARCVPTRRYFNLAYQIGELKDLPMSLRSTLRTWLDIELAMGREGFNRAFRDSKWWTRERQRHFAPYLKDCGIDRPLDKSLSELYLNFKFGWESIYQAVNKLVLTPQRVTKEVNYLIRRNGKFTKLSTTKRWSEAAPATIQWLYPSHPTYYNFGDGLSTSAVRDVSLRCVCDVGFHFPPLSVPALRKQLYSDKLGLYPSPGDLYDLVPWTWIVDWFVGIGDYIHLMDRINGSDNLINYGFMTYKSRVRNRADWSYTGTSTTSITVDGINHTDSNISKPRMSAFIDLNYELRYSIARLVGVKTYSGQGLSLDQSTILGALLSQFA